MRGSLTAFPLRLMGPCAVYSLGGRIVGVRGGVTHALVGLCKVRAKWRRMVDGEWVKADDAMRMMQC